MTGSKTADYLIFAVTVLMLLIANIMLVYDVLTTESTLTIVLIWHICVSSIKRFVLRNQLKMGKSTESVE